MLIVAWRKVLSNGDAFCVGNVLDDLFAKSANENRVGGYKVVRADDDFVVLNEGIRLSLVPQSVVRRTFENGGRQVELFVKFLLPLLSKGGGNDQKYSSFSLSPSLRPIVSVWLTIKHR